MIHLVRVWAEDDTWTIKELLAKPGCPDVSRAPTHVSMFTLGVNGKATKALRMEQAQCSAVCGISAAREPPSAGPSMFAHARLVGFCISRHNFWN